MKFYSEIEKYAKKEMEGVAHGWQHVIRVKKNALRIAVDYPDADREIIVYAVLLHDVGRNVKGKNHAEVGAEKSREFLNKLGMNTEIIDRIVHAIRTHRYRDREMPETLEAKILFDADKLDAIGMIGAARAIAYAVEHGEPIYMNLQDAERESRDPANKEFEVKLKHIPKVLITESGKTLANKRMMSMEKFFYDLSEECDE
jgi:uncharacterized protein